MDQIAGEVVLHAVKGLSGAGRELAASRLRWSDLTHRASRNKIDTLSEPEVGNGEVLLAVAIEIAHRY